ncbi:hypothetical protein DFH09DRAFT_1093083 [Mycena vulgaris]|nr:hypothetical protein DFH09DRAFT_1093083 [Mycena vulgaris]
MAIPSPLPSARTSMLPQPSPSPKLPGQGSFRAIAPRTLAFVPDPASPKKRKRPDTSDDAGPTAKKAQTGRKFSYCPVCHRPYGEVSTRNNHIGLPICVKAATSRGLPIPASFEAQKSSNRLDHLKESSERFAAADQLLKAGLQRGKKRAPPVAGLSSDSGIPGNSPDESARFPSFSVATPDIRATAQKTLFAARSPTLGGLSHLVQDDRLRARDAPPNGNASHHSFSDSRGRYPSLQHPHSSRPVPRPVPQQPALQRSASYPLLQQQQPRSPSPVRLSHATSWIQPQSAHPQPARVQAAASFGGYDTPYNNVSPAPAFSSSRQPYLRAPAQLQAAASFSGCDAARAYYAPQSYPRASQPPNGYAMVQSGQNSTAVYGQSQVPQQTFSPADAYVRPPTVRAHSGTPGYAQHVPYPHAPYAHSASQQEREKYLWNTYEPRDGRISLIVPPRPQSRSTGPSGGYAMPQNSGFEASSSRGHSREYDHAGTSSNGYAAALPANPSPIFYAQQSTSPVYETGEIAAPQASVPDAEPVQFEPPQVEEEDSASAEELAYEGQAASPEDETSEEEHGETEAAGSETEEELKARLFLEAVLADMNSSSPESTASASPPASNDSPTDIFGQAFAWEDLLSGGSSRDSSPSSSASPWYMPLSWGGEKE